MLRRGPVQELENGDLQFTVVVAKADRAAFFVEYPDRELRLQPTPSAAPASQSAAPPPQFLSAAGIDSGGIGMTDLPLSDLQGRIFGLITNPQFQAFGMAQKRLGVDAIPDAEEFAAVFLQELVGQSLEQFTEADLQRALTLFGGDKK